MMQNSPFAPFRFTDGESYMTSTDAQTTDFGTGIHPTQHLFVTVKNGVTDQTQRFNTTPEPSSGFGAQFLSFGARVPKRPIAIRPVAKNPHGGGLRSTAGAVSGSKAVGKLATTNDSLQRSRFDTTQKSVETVRSRYYFGQL